MQEEGRDILLQKVIELTEENNKLLHKLVGYQRTSRILSILKWVVIIGLTFGAYYYIQPLVDQAIDSYRNLGVTIPEPNSLSGLLQIF